MHLTHEHVPPGVPFHYPQDPVVAHAPALTTWAPKLDSRAHHVLPPAQITFAAASTTTPSCYPTAMDQRQQVGSLAPTYPLPTCASKHYIHAAYAPS